MRTSPLIVLLLLGGTSGGCERTESAQQPTQPAAQTQPATRAAYPRYGWYQTLGDEATQLLIAKLTIPGVFVPGVLGEQAVQIRLARYIRIDAEGWKQLPPLRYFGRTNADGRNEKGGFGFGGSIDVSQDEADDDAVIIEINYSWKTPDQDRGKLTENVPARVGVPLDAQLPGGGRLQVSWQELP